MSRHAGAAALALAAVALAACNPQSAKNAATPTPGTSTAPTPPSLHVTGQGTSQRPARFFGQNHNRVEYELQASSFESKGPQGKARVIFQNARILFHGKDGVTTTATAPEAVLDETTNTVTLINGVHASNSSGMKLQCDTLVYDRAAQTLRGNGDVTIADPRGFRGTGSRFDSDVSLTHVHMI